MSLDTAPSWNAQDWGAPSSPSVVAMEGFTGYASSSPKAGDTFTVSGTVANLGAPDATGMAVHLDVPLGWTATALTPTSIDTLPAGASQAVSWKVTIPATAPTGSYAVAAEVSYQQGGRAGQTGASYGLGVTGVPKGTVYLSDRPWTSAVSGWHSVLADESVNATLLSIAHAAYAKGLGTNSVSTIVYDVPAGCTTFSSDVGVDDSAGGKGSVTFSVLADGVQVASTGVMRGGQTAQSLTATLAGIKQLTLVVGDAGDGNGHDNADWAGAQMHCGS
jgi:endo-alpha-N-acetylgalactosaminidase